MRKRYIVRSNHHDYDVKACWTHAGATRWIKRNYAIRSFWHVEYMR